MPRIELLVSPGVSYLEHLTATIRSARSVTLITAFASCSGIDLLADALRHMLNDTRSQARVILAIERQGFNSAAVLDRLQALQREFPNRLFVGVVLQGAGILHAKALLAQHDHGTDIIVGSANLTRNALGTNHEMGVHIHEADWNLVSAFEAFVGSLPARALDPDEPLTPVTTPRPTRPGGAGANAWRELVAKVIQLAPMAPLVVAPDEYLAGWIHQGFLVGRGRRGTEVLSIRLPMEDLEHRGLVQARHRRDLGDAARERRLLSYSVELLPPDVSKEVRQAARRLSSLPARLSLNLPCFGMWMPAPCWETFEGARAELMREGALSHERLRAQATLQHVHLQRGGLEAAVARVMERLQKEDGLPAQHTATVKKELEDYLRRELSSRTPEVIVRALEFRTARQVWTPYDQTDTPHRQLMADLIQATFQATFKTGRWPGQFRSYAAREVATAIEVKLGRAGLAADGSSALHLLDLAASWEDPERPFTEVVDEFRRFVPEEMEFSVPSVDELIAESRAEKVAEDDDD